MRTDITHRLITEKEAAHVLRVSRRWLQEKRYRGEGPPYLRLSPKRLIRYQVDDLLHWAEARVVEDS